MAGIADLMVQLDPESGLRQLFEDRWNEQEAHTKNLAQKVEQLTVKCNSISRDFEVSLLKNVQLQQNMENLHASVQTGEVFKEACSESFDQQVRARMEADEIDYVDAVGIIVAEMQQEMQLQAARLQRVLAENYQYKNDILTNVPIFNAIKQDPKLHFLAKFLTTPPQLLPDVRECITFLQANYEEQQQKLATALYQLESLSQMYYQQNEVVKSAEYEVSANKQEKAIVEQYLQGDVEAKGQHIKELEQALKRLDDDYQTALQQIYEFYEQLYELYEGLKTGAVYAGSSARADQFLHRLAPGKDFIDAVLQDEEEIADEKHRIEELYQAAERELEMIRGSDVFKNAGVQFKADVPVAYVLEDHLLDVYKQLESSKLAALAAEDAAEVANDYIESLQAEKATLEAEKQNAYYELECMYAELERLQEKSKLTAKELGKARDESAERQSDLEFKNKELERYISDLEYENEKMQVAIEQANSRIESKQAEIGEFQNLIAQKAAYVAIQERQIADLEDYLKSLRNDARSGELFRPMHAAFVEKARECAAWLRKQSSATPATGVNSALDLPNSAEAEREAMASGDSAESGLPTDKQQRLESDVGSDLETDLVGDYRAHAENQPGAAHVTQKASTGRARDDLPKSPRNQAPENAQQGVRREQSEETENEAESGLSSDPQSALRLDSQDVQQNSAGSKPGSGFNGPAKVPGASDSTSPGARSGRSGRSAALEKLEKTERPERSAKIAATTTNKTDLDFLDGAEALLSARERENEALRARCAELSGALESAARETDRNVPFFRKLYNPYSLYPFLSAPAALAFRTALQRPETLFADIGAHLGNYYAQAARAEQALKQSEQRLRALYADLYEAKTALLAKEQAVLHHQNAAEQASKYAQIARMNSKHYCLSGLSNLNYISQILILNKELARRQDEQMCIIIQNTAIIASALKDLQARYGAAAALHDQHALAVKNACEHAQSTLYSAQVKEQQLLRQTAVLYKQCAVLEAQSLHSQLGASECFEGTLDAGVYRGFERGLSAGLDGRLGFVGIERGQIASVGTGCGGPENGAFEPAALGKGTGTGAI